MITTEIKKARTYEQIITYLVNMRKIGNKFAIVSYTDKQPTFSKNFWNLYKKKAKNDEIQKLFNYMFLNASVWKAPNGTWRFYFNEDSLSIFEDRYSKYLYMEHIQERFPEVDLNLKKIKNLSYDNLMDIMIDLRDLKK